MVGLEQGLIAAYVIETLVLMQMCFECEDIAMLPGKSRFRRLAQLRKSHELFRISIFLVKQDNATVK
jgi:hypothetical protein